LADIVVFPSTFTESSSARGDKTTTIELGLRRLFTSVDVRLEEQRAQKSISFQDEKNSLLRYLPLLFTEQIRKIQVPLKLHLLLQPSGNLIRLRHCEFLLVNSSQSIDITTIYYCPLILLNVTFKQRIRSVDCSKLFFVNKTKLQISAPIVSALAFVTKSSLHTPNQNLDIRYSHNSRRSARNNFLNWDLHDNRTKDPPPARVQRGLEVDCNLDWGNCKGLTLHRMKLSCSHHPQRANISYWYG
jgi:hypothetical protein